MGKRFGSGDLLRAGAWLIVASTMVVQSALAKDEDEGWSGEVNAAISAQSGTSDTFGGTLEAKGTRTWERDVASLRFSGTYGTSRNRDRGNPGNEKTNTIQDAQGLYGAWKHTLTERLFWDSNTELSRDSTQNRDVRFRVDTGPGLRVWQGEAPKKEHFDMSVGLGYRYEVYDGNANDGPNGADKDEDQFVDLVAGFEYKNGLFEDKVEYTHTGSVYAPANDFNAFIARTEVIFGIPLTEAWSFRTGVLAEWTNDVPDGISNLTTRTTVGLGYKF